ncbi:MAG: sigma 54-interacting transcriptional regulator [Desulfovibrionaceae bacterium]|nr:sigma 54-interacting transcriptional regulator [Desulfovibrionaceae bacterium]
MPGYKAEDLIARGSANGGFPPVVVFTDKGSVDEAKRFLELGARDYWVGPLTWDKVATVLPDGPPEPAPAPAPVPPAPQAPPQGTHEIPHTLGHAHGVPAAGHASGHSPGHAAGHAAAQPVPAQPAPVAPGVTGKGFSIIGQDPAVKRVLALARQVAPSKATVLISGESGTGKEMFAKYLHVSSDRANRPFVAINCAALPEHLLESELFGHEKGAFTGAINRKLGKFELAHGGTLLLDEISEMELGLQAKLLRVLQEGELDRVGGMETIKVDVRVLATTNRSLEQWVEEGKFRQDLYFRLNVIPLRLPALRERGDDALRLADFFISSFCKEYNLPLLALSQEAIDWIRGYAWPGNVRELQNMMERAVLLAGAGPIAKVHFLLDPDAWPLPEDAQADGAGDDEGDEDSPSLSGTAPAASAAPPNLDDVLGGAVVPLQELERIMIMRGLDQTSGNRTRAAEMLGISVRTLRNKLNEYRARGIEL